MNFVSISPEHPCHYGLLTMFVNLMQRKTCSGGHSGLLNENSIYIQHCIAKGMFGDGICRTSFQPIQ